MRRGSGPEPSLRRGLWELLRPIDGPIHVSVPPTVDDYARDLDLRSHGFTVLRFADTQIEDEPARVVADVARALAQEDWSSKR